VAPRNGAKESFRRLLKQLRLPVVPKTANARTGGGGRHYLMTAPFPVKSKTNAFSPEYPGLDIKRGRWLAPNNVANDLVGGLPQKGMD
jgi:hypothetical protein